MRNGPLWAKRYMPFPLAMGTSCLSKVLILWWQNISIHILYTDNLSLLRTNDYNKLIACAGAVTRMRITMINSNFSISPRTIVTRHMTQLALG